MNILLLNQNWFQEELRSFGHTVKSCGADIHFDVRLPVPQLTIEEVCSIAGMTPDCIVIFDNSIPIFVTGLERVTVPMIYYAVDVHHHISWQHLLPEIFDFVFIAQKDYIPHFSRTRQNTLWLPLWASKHVTPTEKKVRQAVFVGTMNRELNPERVAFLESLAVKVPLECMMGEYWKIFPESTVVVNQTVKGDLNFRVFEALMCGSLLVTEETGNGLHDLFTPGTHLLTYKKNDADDAARVIENAFANAEKRKQIEAAGRAEVLNNHTSSSRGAVLHEAIIHLTKLKQSKPQERATIPLMLNFCALSNYFDAEASPPRAKRAMEEALRLLHSALQSGERLNDDTRRIAESLCTHAVRTSGSMLAQSLLGTLSSGT